MRTARVKKIVAEPDLTRPSRNALVAVRDDEPDIAVVFDPNTTPKTIISVVFRTEVNYTRAGESFLQT